MYAMEDSKNEMKQCENNSVFTESIKMFPNFTQCRPIIKYSDIEDCLNNPPEWINRVVPLQKRSGYVIKNTPSDCHSAENQFFPRPRLDARLVPKTLVCHDYKGGYLSDSYLPFEGDEEKTLATEGYTFYNWSQIDYFVYFSHYFITIPPLAWINAGHKNGVKVLGTVITENVDGIKICDEQIFQNRDQMKEFVYQLTEIQKTFGFDGWLLNIENEVKHPSILKEFVGELTTQSHLQDGDAVIIWYDSVINDGKLRWQNQLNELNRDFFDCCDGIFLNYGWNEEKLVSTVKMAGPRHFDIFVGVDVFGRNMYGGGQLNTYKAAELISKHNLSMAIFAPGWSHETLEATPAETFLSRFLNRDDALWASLWPYLYTHPINNLFETNFHIGLDSHQYNMYIQKHQTSQILHPQYLNAIANHQQIMTLSESCDCLKRDFFGSRNSVAISNDNLRRNSGLFVHKLFACDIKLNGKVAVYFLTKKGQSFDDSKLELILLACLKSGSIRKIKLLGNYKTYPTDTLSLLEVNQSKVENIKYNYALNNIARKLKSYQTENVVLSFYEFSTTPCDLLEIGATILRGSSISLLEFGIVQLF